MHTTFEADLTIALIGVQHIGGLLRANSTSSWNLRTKTLDEIKIHDAARAEAQLFLERWC
jgi:hypothetical protein